MKKTVIIALVFAVAATSASLLLQPAPAEAAPVGGCPTGDGWNLTLLAFTLPDGIDVGNFHDQNGDGWICYRVNKGQTKKNNGFPSWTVKDNTNPLPSE